MNIDKKPTVCICGGGGLGHVIAATLANKGFKVNLLTSQPTSWNGLVEAVDPQGRHITGKLSRVADNPQELIPDSDLILLCLPGFLIQDTLCQIRSYLRSGAIVGSVVSSTGFFIMAQQSLPAHIGLFGFQRVPYIARVGEYGKTGQLLGYKKELRVAFKGIDDPIPLQQQLAAMFDLPIIVQKNFLEATLTNSNPILHPTRLYRLFGKYKSGTVYPKHYFFYDDWDDDTSKLLIGCDEEFQRTLDALPIVLDKVPTLLDYYESKDAQSLTKKIRSIQAFKGIKVAMLSQEQGYVPDFSNRYFQEDFPYGLLIIKSLAHLLNVKTPQIDTIIHWGQEMMGKEYLVNNRLEGQDIASSAALTPEILTSFITNTV